MLLCMCFDIQALQQLQGEQMSNAPQQSICDLTHFSICSNEYVSESATFIQYVQGAV